MKSTGAAMGVSTSVTSSGRTRSPFSAFTRDRSLQGYLSPGRPETVTDQLELLDRHHHADGTQRLSGDELEALRSALARSYSRRSDESDAERTERLRKAAQGG